QNQLGCRTNQSHATCGQRHTSTAGSSHDNRRFSPGLNAFGCFRVPFICRKYIPLIIQSILL
ncbi:hypothetical protein L7H74_26150, partial [Klebsiella quasipneumoniae]|uniref:hypothetical protein n=1 Tax=Klebsiella quasipneumoniae TaxID=1463165 RepID=UPI002020FFAE